jgi:hypothetical protein
MPRAAGHCPSLTERDLLDRATATLRGTAAPLAAQASLRRTSGGIPWSKNDRARVSIFASRLPAPTGGSPLSGARPAASRQRTEVK